MAGQTQQNQNSTSSTLIDPLRDLGEIDDDTVDTTGGQPSTENEKIDPLLEALNGLRQDVKEGLRGAQPQQQQPQQVQTQQKKDDGLGALLDDPPIIDAKKLQEEAAEDGATRGIQIYGALRKIEDELSAQFPELTAAERTAIVEGISARPPSEIRGLIENKGHIMIANATYGAAVKAGRIKPGAKAEADQMAVTPVGSVTGGGKRVDPNSTVSKFEAMYGKPTKGMRERLGA